MRGARSRRSARRLARSSSSPDGRRDRLEDGRLSLGAGRLRGAVGGVGGAGGVGGGGGAGGGCGGRGEGPLRPPAVPPAAGGGGAHRGGGGPGRSGPRGPGLAGRAALWLPAGRRAA